MNPATLRSSSTTRILMRSISAGDRCADWKFPVKISSRCRGGHFQDEASAHARARDRMELAPEQPREAARQGQPEANPPALLARLRHVDVEDLLHVRRRHAGALVLDRVDDARSTDAD